MQTFLFMIQRIQTVLLLLATIAMGLLFIFPYVEVASDDYFVFEYPIMSAFTAIVVIGFLITIFLYKNRNLQYRIARALLLFIIAFVGYGIYQLSQVNFEQISFEFGGVLPIVAGILASFAASKIKQDEDLVRSVDRLR